MRLLVFALALALACLAPSGAATGGGHSHGSATTSSHSSTHSGGSHAATGSHSGGSHSSKWHSTSSHSHSKAAPGVHRDSHGKIARDPRQTNAFKRQHPCPSTGKTSGSCPGYVIDHVIPLKRGGADSPSNMQWQTKGAAKQKDKWE